MEFVQNFWRPRIPLLNEPYMILRNHILNLSCMHAMAQFHHGSLPSSDIIDMNGNDRQWRGSPWICMLATFMARTYRMSNDKERLDV
jgi:hypothetical protein